MSSWGIISPSHEETTKAMLFLKNSMAVADYFSEVEEKFFDELIINIYIVFRFLRNSRIVSKQGFHHGPCSHDTFSVKMEDFLITVSKLFGYPINNVMFSHNDLVIDDEKIVLFSFCVDDEKSRFILPLHYTGCDNHINDQTAICKLKKIYRALNGYGAFEFGEFEAIPCEKSKKIRWPSCKTSAYTGSLHLAPRARTVESYDMTCRIAIYAAMLKIQSYYSYFPECEKFPLCNSETKFKSVDEGSENRLKKCIEWLSSSEVSLSKSTVNFERLQSDDMVYTYIFVAECHGQEMCGFFNYQRGIGEVPLTQEDFDKRVRPYLVEHKIRRFFDVPMFYKSNLRDEFSTVNGFMNYLLGYADIYVDFLHALLFHINSPEIKNHVVFSRAEEKIQQVLSENLSMIGVEFTQKNLPIIFRDLETKLFVHKDKQTACLVYRVPAFRKRTVRSGWVISSREAQLSFDYQKWAIGCYNSYIPEEERCRYRYRDDIVTRCSLSARLSY